MMKLTDYLVQFIADQGVKAVFGYQGGSISHVIDALSCHPRVRYVQMRHEQAAAFAANGYALQTGAMGVALSCSGPGATNLLTGIADAYYDSLPCLFLTGQVSTSEMKKNPEVRQFGFQETDIVSIVSSITKYAVTVTDPERIAFELEKAVYLMQEGRPGPVVIDIPHNVQTRAIDPEKLEHFAAATLPAVPCGQFYAAETAQWMTKSKCPVILLGGGSRALKQNKPLLDFLEGLPVPIVASYRGKDVLDHSAPNFCGVIGAYGNRSANYAVKSCDLLLCIGSRLDGRQTGGNFDTFADAAKVITVDIDATELGEKPKQYFGIHADCVDFLTALSAEKIEKDDRWLTTVKRWQQRYPDFAEYHIAEGVNPNLFLNRLSDAANGKTSYAVDVGQNQIWANASLRSKRGDFILQSCGLGSMGFALPAAIGAYCANGNPTICLCGDGGFQMNLQELQTVVNQQIPLKIFVFNNHSLGLIRVYQSKALGSRFFGSVEGFGSPDYELLAKAYGIVYHKITTSDCQAELNGILHATAACLVEVLVSDESTCCPEPTYQSTVENQSPMLSAEEKMIIKREIYESDR